MTSRTARRLLVIAGAAATVLLVAEVGARLLSPYLPEPPTWPDEATAVKIAQMDDRGCVEVVFAGNSMARDAFDPVLFTEQDPASRSAYNASLDAASPAQLERWLPDQVLPRLDPATVVLALSSADLNENGSAAASAARSYAEAPGARTDLLGRIQAEMADRLDLVAYRDSLRDPAVVAESLSRARKGTATPRADADGIPGVLGAEGQGLSRTELRYEGGGAVQQFVAEQLLDEFAVGGHQTEAATRLVRSLQADDVEVVLVVLPVTEDYVGLHPRGDADFEAFLHAMDELASETGAPLLDLRRGYDDALFADTHHLNGAGAATLTRAVSSELGPVTDHDRSRCEPST